MITSKFSIGQQVRHKLLGNLGVIIDIDSAYSLEQPKLDEVAANNNLREAPWYHVVMEDEKGQPIHTYLAEIQLAGENDDIHLEHPSLDELAQSIRNRFLSPRLRH